MKTIFFILLIITCQLYSQTEKVVHVSSADTATWALSQIAEGVTPIMLNDFYGRIQFIYLTNEYLYTCGVNSISQFDLSGNHLKTVTCGYIRCLIGDTVRKEIYISIGENKVICYNNSLEEKRIYETKYSPNSLFFHKNKLWIQSIYEESDNIEVDKLNTTYYKISSLDLATGKENFLSFSFGDDKQISVQIKARLIAEATFSIYQDQLVFSNWLDPVIYVIKDDKIYPILKWDVEETERMSHERFLTTQGFIGKYLSITYRMRDKVTQNLKEFRYIEDMETETGYNLNSYISDDIFHTGPCKLHNCYKNNESYLYFLKETSNGHEIFIVKPKQQNNETQLSIKDLISF